MSGYSEPPLSERRPLVRRILPWLPVAVMVLAAASLAIIMLQGGMRKVSAWYLFQVIPPLLGLLCLVGTVLYALIRRRLTKAIAATILVSLLSIAPAIQMFAPVVAYPASLDSMAPAATVRLPADGPLKVVSGGDTAEVNNHVVVPDQRWAYDFVVEPYFTGSASLADYGCYGVPVVAPTAGLVVMARDGLPDMVPGTSSNNTEAPYGNVVAIELETGTYLIIAHLKPGSVAVREGERVEEGQAIGQCGNSGNTSEPHIHIHHQRQDPNDYPINFAEGLPLYFRGHDGPPMPEGGVTVVDGKLIAIGATVRHTGQ